MWIDKLRIITLDYKGVTKRSVKILPNYQRVCKEELNVKSSELSSSSQNSNRN